MGLNVTLFYRRLAAALIVVLTMAVAMAVPAVAHDELVSTTPANGAVLKGPPTALVLNFAEPPLAGTSEVVATDHSGNVVKLGKPSVDGSTITVAWPESSPAGTYEAAWRVVSDDGHPVNGKWTFSYGAATPESLEPRPYVPPSDNNPSSSSLPLIIVAAGVLVIAAIGATLLVRHRKRSTNDQQV